MSRYILREFLVPLGYCLAGFVGIYVLFELFGSFSRIMDSGLPARTIVRYFLAYLGPYFMYLAPAALMLATLYTMWNFCRHSELVAMRASGVGFFAISKPILAVSLAMAAFVAWVNESYVPREAQWAKRLRTERFNMQKMERSDDIVYRNSRDNRVWTAESLAYSSGMHLLNVKVTQDRTNGARFYCILAERADYLDREWWFTNPKTIHYDEKGDEVASITRDADALPLRAMPQFDERPSDILLQNRDWRFNSVREKLRFIKAHKDLTEDQRRGFRYDAIAQIVSPFACILMTLLAIPAGISSGRQSVFKGILGALAMFFAYYALAIGGMVLADKGVLNPVVCAVAPPVVFLAVACRSFYRHR
ncbi:MAG: LptF/LptG family permease [Kiritimatiellae bacterium]|nr:LptF/LptG family permease [Kiritimatiellia bacterium]